ncbi:uL11 family ribosomal protein [Candidatus Vidania fulgoroideorum]
MKIKLILKPGNAKPNSSIGSSIGSKGVNVNNFCKKFNDMTNDGNKLMIPVVVTIYDNKKFKIKLKTPTVSYLLKKFMKSNKKLSKKIINKIYLIKKNSFNTFDKKKIIKTIMGSVKSMGLKC